MNDISNDPLVRLLMREPGGGEKSLPRYPSYDTPEEAYQAERPPQWPEMPETPEEYVTVMYHLTDDASTVDETKPDWIPDSAIGCAGTAPILIACSTGVESRTAIQDGKGGWHWFEWTDVSSMAANGILSFFLPRSGGGFGGSEFEITQYRAKGSGYITSVKSYDFNEGWIDNIAVEIAVNIPHATTFALASQGTTPSMYSLQFAAVYGMGANTATTKNNYFAYHDNLRVVRAFNTGSAKRLYGAFYGCKDLIETGLTSLGLVYDINYMLQDAEEIAHLPNVDYSGVITAMYAFAGCDSLLDIPELTMASCENAGHLFSNCERLRHIGKISIKGSTSSGESLSLAFMSTPELRRIDEIEFTTTAASSKLLANMLNSSSVVSVGRVDAPLATSLDSAFYGASTLTAIPTLSVAEQSGISAASVCHGCTSLTDISALAPFSFGDMHSAFYECSSLVDVSQLDMSHVTSLYQAFYKCVKLNAFGDIDAPLCMSLYQAFYACTKLVSVGDIDMPVGTSVYMTFYNCSSLLTVGDIYAPKSTTFEEAFRGCTKLLSVGEIDTSAATNVSYMFNNCASLQDVPELDLRKVTLTSSSSYYGVNYMFQGCTSLVTIERLRIGYATTSTQYLSYLYLYGTSSAKRKLEHILFDPTVTDWSGGAFSLAYNNIGHDAMVEFFESLPTLRSGTSAKAITITGNPGADGLYASEIEIATDKGWSITGATNIKQEHTITMISNDDKEIYLADSNDDPLEGEVSIQTVGGVVPQSIAEVPVIKYLNGTYVRGVYDEDYLFATSDGTAIQPGEELTDDVIVKPVPIIWGPPPSDREYTIHFVPTEHTVDIIPFGTVTIVGNLDTVSTVDGGKVPALPELEWDGSNSYSPVWEVEKPGYVPSVDADGNPYDEHVVHEGDQLVSTDDDVYLNVNIR